ncbi:protein toll [Fopius arisanus]|uniref:Protein toll n=1 Tax=Fopius arisanus TaxID=64838 RepID=A0A0C9PYP0_9HYME|nr:PREDICTED: protein toll [Fopius arisanus]
MLVQLSLVLIVIAIPPSSADQCPLGRGCGGCDHLPENQYEIRCSTNSSDSMFIVNYRPNIWVKIDCYNSPNWSEFYLGREGQIRDVDVISFRMCQLPGNEKLGAIVRQIIANDVKELSLQLSDNLSSTLTRKTLSDFRSLETLVLSRNKLTNVTADLLHDLQNLTLLNLRENDLRELPHGFLDIPHLESIELGSNKLEIIEPAIFQNLEKLKLLNIWSNKLVEIKPHSFDKLKSIRSIDMHSNNLQTLPRDIFAPLKNLIVVNLSQNNFTANSLPEGLFSNNSLLRNVIFFENKQNLTTLPSKFFAGLTHLTSITMRRNRLVYLPEDLLTGTVNLRNISMEWNYIESLPRGIFKDCKDLFSINLSYNELRELPIGLFSTLHNLEKLDLSRNHITEISGNLFHGLSSLKVLNLERNGLKTIHPDGLRPLQNLRIARFSSNLLTLKSNPSPSIEGDRLTSPFYPCTRIEELHLANNNISDIFFDWATAPQLRTLDLQYNSLRFLHAQDVFFLSENLYVDLSFNRIELISLTYAEAFATPREYPKKVIVSVENNPINCDCDIYDLLRYREGDMDPKVQNNVHLKMEKLKCQKPSGLLNLSVENLKSKSLKCLVENPEIYNATCPGKCECWLQPSKRAYLIDCSYQGLTVAPQSLKAPGGLTIELNLNGNFLKKMPSMRQPGYEAVTALSLSKNEIMELSQSSLSKNLRVLTLDSNNLTRLDKPVLEFLVNSSALRNLSLQGNPWECDCDAREFLSFIQSKKNDIPELQEVKCKYPGENSIFEMTPEDMCPLAVAGIIGVCIGIALLGVIVGIIAALYYRFQREIKVWLYSKQWCLWFVTEAELDKDKLYDAFISYSHKDEEFVVKNLITKLEEGPRPFKLCVHFRDWLAGEWIPNQIARSVQDSRRTIVVLSPNFLESVWGKMEFRTAHNQALSEGRARVIVILYGEIGPVDDLDPELKAYLTMNTYVKWGDPWFWQKLKYALPHPDDLVRNKKRQSVFESQHPTIVIANDKSELIDGGKENLGTTAASTPPADTIKTFVGGGNEASKNAINDCLSEQAKGNGAPICDSVKINGKIEKLHCTTV